MIGGTWAVVSMAETEEIDCFLSDIFTRLLKTTVNSADGPAV